MRQISRSIDTKTGTGSVRLEAADAEDMWHVYNLLSEGDQLRCSTIRKVQSETATGSVSAQRMRLTLTVIILSFEFDASVSQIRVSGRVASENQHVSSGSHHTLELEPHRAFTLFKEAWDVVHLEHLETALDPQTDAELGAIVMQDGLAHIMLVSRSLTITRARVETAIPRKGKNALYNRDSAMKKFFGDVFRALMQSLELSRLKVLLIASPGFVKDEFFKFAQLEASRHDLRDFIENKSKVVLCHSSSGHKHAFQEVLSRPELQTRLASTKAVAEVRVLDEFFEMMHKDSDRAVYGPAHVKFASEMGAVQQLLVTNKLFRSADVQLRKKYIALLESVEQAGATVVRFSSEHVTGERLDSMTGVAAILRFPLPGLDDVDPSEGL
ncbi:Translation release factor pelota [Gracilaria domingensis]|nr:Translation release factor pelota [Gracilaria domingensis]